MPTARRLLDPVALDHEFAPAITLVAGASVALAYSKLFATSYFRTVYANSTWSPLRELGVSSLHDLTVNLLMVVFFFALGLEVAHEFAPAPLARVRSALPAVCGAAGGMLATALGSLAAGEILHSAALVRGWGIPMATDVAFTLALLAVAGRRLPSHVRVFLLTLAICDDVLSVIVLSLSGHAHLRWWGLVLTVVTTSAVVIVRGRVSGVVVVAAVVALWLAFSAANLEPALAGLIGGAVLGAAPWRTSAHAIANRVSVGLVLPLYAFVACGLQWSHVGFRGAVGAVVIATIAVRLVGKSLGITAGVQFAYATGMSPSARMAPSLLATLGLTCAIGFTVPLFFAARIFGANTVLYDAFALGLLLSSLVAAVAGGLLIHSRRGIE